MRAQYALRLRLFRPLGSIRLRILAPLFRPSGLNTLCGYGYFAHAGSIRLRSETPTGLFWVVHSFSPSSRLRRQLGATRQNPYGVHSLIHPLRGSFWVVHSFSPSSRLRRQLGATRPKPLRGSFWSADQVAELGEWCVKISVKNNSRPFLAEILGSKWR